TTTAPPLPTHSGEHRPSTLRPTLAASHVHLLPFMSDPAPDFSPAQSSRSAFAARFEISPGEDVIAPPYRPDQRVRRSSGFVPPAPIHQVRAVLWLKGVQPSVQRLCLRSC